MYQIRTHETRNIFCVLTNALKRFVAAHKKMEMNNHELIMAVVDSRTPIERTAVIVYQQRLETTQLEWSRVPGQLTLNPNYHIYMDLAATMKTAGVFTEKSNPTSLRDKMMHHLLTASIEMIKMLYHILLLSHRYRFWFFCKFYVLGDTVKLTSLTRHVLPF